MSPKKNNSLKVTVAKHGVRIDDLEQRVGERRDADGKIFDKLDDINKGLSDFKTDVSESITELKVDFAGWKGRVAVGGTLAVLFLSAVVGALFRYVF